MKPSLTEFLAETIDLMPPIAGMAYLNWVLATNYSTTDVAAA